MVMEIKCEGFGLGLACFHNNISEAAFWMAQLLRYFGGISVDIERENKKVCTVLGHHSSGGRALC